MSGLSKHIKCVGGWGVGGGVFLRAESSKLVLCLVLKKSNRYGFIFERAAWQFQLLAGDVHLYFEGRGQTKYTVAELQKSALSYTKKHLISFESNSDYFC